MVSFGRLGLIEQDRASGHYLLGPLALQLGLIGLQQADPVHVATPLIADAGARASATPWRSRCGATAARPSCALRESPARGARQHAPRHGVLADQHRVGAAVRRLPRRRRWCAGCSKKSAGANARRRRRRAAGAACRVAPLPRLERVRGAAARGAHARHQPLRRRGRAGRQCDVGAGVRSHGARWCWRSPPSGRPASSSTAWDGEIANALGSAARGVSQRLGALRAPQPSAGPAPAFLSRR